MFRHIKTLSDVVDWGLCTGCGACFYACAKSGIALVDIPKIGIRPRFDSPDCTACTACLSICPGYSVDGNLETGSKPDTADDGGFGPALEIWEGHARDPEIRYRASSGGVLSALALHCLENEGMQFVLHTGADSEQPWMNRTVKSTARAELLSHAGSRYAPSSPCDGLQSIEESDRQCVFVGKPCDAAAVAMLRRQRPELDRKLGLVLTFFCAGTPSTQGTLDLIAALNLDPASIDKVSYRGEGWPGRFTVRRGAGEKPSSLSYAESWNRLTGYRPLRCNLCPDGLGSIADISCGDAWHKHNGDGDPGRSLVVVRTPRGSEVLQRAMTAGYVDLQRVGARAVVAAQPSLLQRRSELFGRLLAMRLLFIPAPQFTGFPLSHAWIRQPLGIQLRSVLGTIQRILRRGWYKRRPVFET
jgi:coenzyme F420 hydrogenase subunit beta